MSSLKSWYARSSVNSFVTAADAHSSARIHPPSEMRCARSASLSWTSSFSTSFWVAASWSLSASVFFFLAFSSSDLAWRLTRSPAPSARPYFDRFLAMGSMSSM